MGVPRPNIPIPSPGVLVPALRGMGLPAPVEVTHLAPAWTHVNYRLRFPPFSGFPDLMLRRVVASPGIDTLQHELAALTLLKQVEDLPVVRDYSIFPDGALPWSAALSGLLPGVQGMAVLRNRSEWASFVCQEVGRVMRTLHDRPQPSFGTGCEAGRFFPRRTDWTSEWRSTIATWIGLSNAAGVDLGPLSNHLIRRIQLALPALGKVKRWALVHGDLHPSNLLFEAPSEESSPPTLSGIIDWEGAILGDPLVEWSLALELPAATLGHILLGFGTDLPRKWLSDPAALDRLSIYTWTRCLRRLAFAGTALMRGEHGRRRGYALEQARVVCRELGQVRAVRRKLNAALELADSGPIVRQVPVKSSHSLIWQTLEAPRFLPGVGQSRAHLFFGALSASLLGLAGSDEESNWVEMGMNLADALGPQWDYQPAEPIADRSAWAGELHQRIIGVEPSLQAFAVANWWLILESQSRMSSPNPAIWTVGDALLRGLETMLQAQLSAESLGFDSTMSPKRRMVVSLLGLAAHTALPNLMPGGSHAWPRQWMREQSAMAWADLTLFGDAAQPEPLDVEAVRMTWSQPQRRRRPDDWMVPSLLVALSVIPVANLPAERGMILAVLLAAE